MSNELSRPELLSPAATDAAGGGVTTSRSGELSTILEAQAGYALAQQYPRDEADARKRLKAECKDFEFAIKAGYKFPKGGKDILGPSTWLLRAAAREWGHIDYGWEPCFEDDDLIIVRGWAIDRQRNVRTVKSYRVRKLVPRKVGGRTELVAPSEQDMTMLVAKAGAIAERNCLAHVLPFSYVNAAYKMCIATQRVSDKKGLPEKLQSMLDTFAGMGANQEAVEQYVGKPFADFTLDDLTDLRSVYNAIHEGGMSWTQYVAARSPQPDVEQGMTIEDVIGQEEPDGPAEQTGDDGETGGADVP